MTSAFRVVRDYKMPGKIGLYKVKIVVRGIQVEGPKQLKNIGRHLWTFPFFLGIHSRVIYCFIYNYLNLTSLENEIKICVIMFFLSRILDFRLHLQFSFFLFRCIPYCVFHRNDILWYSNFLPRSSYRSILRFGWYDSSRTTLSPF